MSNKLPRDLRASEIEPGMTIAEYGDLDEIRVGTVDQKGDLMIVRPLGGGDEIYLDCDTVVELQKHEALTADELISAFGWARRQADLEIESLEASVLDLCRQAVDAGATWTALGEAVGVSRQAIKVRYGSKIGVS